MWGINYGNLTPFCRVWLLACSLWAATVPFFNSVVTVTIFAYWYPSPKGMSVFLILNPSWLLTCRKSDSKRGHKSNAASSCFSLGMLYPWIPAAMLWGSPSGHTRRPHIRRDQQPQGCNQQSLNLALALQPAAGTDCQSSKEMGLWRIPEPNPRLCSSLLFLLKVVCVFPSVDCRHQRKAIFTCPFQILTHGTQEYNQMVSVLHLWVFILPEVLDHRLQQQCHSLQLLNSFFS